MRMCTTNKFSLGDCLKEKNGKITARSRRLPGVAMAVWLTVPTNGKYQYFSDFASVRMFVS